MYINVIVSAVPNIRKHFHFWSMNNLFYSLDRWGDSMKCQTFVPIQTSWIRFSTRQYPFLLYNIPYSILQNCVLCSSVSFSSICAIQPAHWHFTLAFNHTNKGLCFRESGGDSSWSPEQWYVYGSSDCCWSVAPVDMPSWWCCLQHTDSNMDCYVLCFTLIF